jgi:DNA-binding transcriptional regulator GbsR (MarR family)
MDSFEISGIIWEAMVVSEKPVSIKKIAEETGIDIIVLRKTIGNLLRNGLVSTENPTSNNPLFIGVKNLDAIRWARAVEMGIPLSLVEKYAVLEKKERAEALKAATDGTLEAIKNAQKQELAENRHRILKGRAASKAASTDLALLAKDLEEALKLAPVDSIENRAARLVLEQAFKESQNALNELIQRLMR